MRLFCDNQKYYYLTLYGFCHPGNSYRGIDKKKLFGMNNRK